MRSKEGEDVQSHRMTGKEGQRNRSTKLPTLIPIVGRARSFEERGAI